MRRGPKCLLIGVYAFAGFVLFIAMIIGLFELSIYLGKSIYEYTGGLSPYAPAGFILSGFAIVFGTFVGTITTILCCIGAFEPTITSKDEADED